MGLFGRNKDKTPPAPAEPDAAKSLVITQELSSYVHEFGWPTGTAYGLIYRRQPAVRTVVDFLAKNIAQLNPKVYLRTSGSDREEIDMHGLAVLLRRPNPDTTRFRLLRDLVSDIAVHDRAYLQKDQVPFPKAIVRVPASRIRRTEEDGKVVYRQPDGKLIPRERLVVFSGYAPDGDWRDEDGVSPMETLRRVLAEESSSQLHRQNMWQNAARQAGVIERPVDAPPWDDPGRQRFRTDWTNTTTGAGNAGRTAVLEEGMHWNPSSFSPKDTEYIEGRRLTFEEVCRAYNMSPQLFAGDSANANIEAFHRHLYQDTLGPWLRMLQDELELQLLPDFRDPSTLRIYVEFNLGEKLKGSFEEQARTLVTAVGVPYIAVNEGRALLNLPRIDDGAFDTPIQPLNVMYGGQPAVTVPTEVPQPKRRAQKSAPAGAIRRRNEAAKTHTVLFERYFKAQSKAVKAKAAAFDMDRWNQKLTGELYSARVNLAGKTGKLAATQIGGVYDEKRTLNFLQEGARRQAERVNNQTAELLDAAEDEEAVAAVFEEAASSRSAYLGSSTAVEVINFARHEAAYQSSQEDGKQRTKTWVVTSAKSRHPELDGETVGLDDTFSNGAAWPGDANAGEDEVAGCQCLLDLS